MAQVFSSWHSPSPCSADTLLDSMPSILLSPPVSPSLLNAFSHYSAEDNSALAEFQGLDDNVRSHGNLIDVTDQLADASNWHPGEDSASVCILSPLSNTALNLDVDKDLDFLGYAPMVSAEDMLFLGPLSADTDGVPCEDWRLPEAENLAIQKDQSNSFLFNEGTTVSAGDVDEGNGATGDTPDHRHGNHNHHGHTHDLTAISESFGSCVADMPKLTSAASTTCLASSNQLVMVPSDASMDAPQKLKRRTPKKQKLMSNSKQTNAFDLCDGMEEDDNEMSGVDGKGHASKNLVSERKRRMKLNERLYSLRAIVPKISKMDKASIVADAITYVQDLQKRVKDMHQEILSLQASDIEDGLSSCAFGGINDSSSCVQEDLPRHKVTEFNISSIEQTMHNLRIHCRKGPGVLLQLIKALETLNFDIVSANLTTVTDHVLNSIVVKINDREVFEADGLKKMMEQMLPTFGLDM